MTQTLVDVLRAWAANRPGATACTFLGDGESPEAELTFAALDRRARAMAVLLGSLGARPADRALLLYPQGLDYVVAFLGCLYAGVVAVPAYPPRPNRGLARIETIAGDAQATLALTTDSILALVRPLLGESELLNALHWLATDRLDDGRAETWQPPALGGEMLALLQYTSGSTAAPKGVMVSHDNLMHNQAVIRAAMDHCDGTRFVSWLPLYHDMGLIGNLLQPLYLGGHAVLMSPASFLQRPVRWLRAISRYRGETSGAPDFAYELCVRKIPEHERADLDLASWKVAYNGAEPVRAQTLERFAAAFAPCGFNREALFPCYGLAEATLLVTGRTRAASRVVEASLDPSATPSARPRTVVSCGTPRLGQQVVVVDPDSARPLPPGGVGEIWVSGPSIARGYWRRPEETAATFRATLADSDGTCFLRTGDLGFLRDGELCVTGRSKDLIIVAGVNHYPQDIELTAERSHDALVAAGAAAFGVDVAGQERLVIVHEVERRRLRGLDADEVVAAIRRAVALEHDLGVHAVVLVKPGGVPRTSSGKVRRRACREQFLEGVLPVWAQRITADEAGPQPDAPATPAPAPMRARDAAAIEAWLVAHLARRQGVAEDQVDAEMPFAAHGLTSVEAVSLMGELQDRLGRPIAATTAWEHPTPRALARHLAAQPGSDAAPVHGSALSWPTPDEPIAVIGLGCRFPGADHPDGLWQLLNAGRSGVRRLPRSRAERLGLADVADLPWGGFLEQIDHFDADFFGITPREAAHLDPQQRLLLEVAWEALEHAGRAPKGLAGTRTGVFVGISTHDYAHLALDPRQPLDSFAGTGNASSIAANRLSYFLDLRGPSLAVDSACSSSLLAVHLACQSLRRGECGLALAAGVNLILTPALTGVFTQAGMMSPTGRCRTFDADADGYVRGEGCGVVVLAPLSAALQAGDRILAVIRGSALAQDGRTNGLTAPNGLAQQVVVREALAQAGVAPHEIGYVETHGTGTPLGDPIEFEALRSVLLDRREPDQRCVLGAIKTQLGHLEAAAGIAGLIKTVLVLLHETIPPNLHLTRLNPRMRLDGTPFVLPSEACAWPRTATRRIAGVSSFGFGGTNCHVVLEEAPRVPAYEDAAQATPRAPADLLTLSATTPAALGELARRYAALAAAPSVVPLADACFTSRAGRSHFAQRLAVRARSWEELGRALADFSAGRPTPAPSSGGGGVRPDIKLAFVFSDEVGCRVGLARALFETQPVFRGALADCADVLRGFTDEPLIARLYPPADAPQALAGTAFAPVAVLCVQHALTRLWRAWGVEPRAVMGYGLGEYAAAWAAGRLRLEDALRLAVERGRVAETLPQAARAVAWVSQERARELLDVAAPAVRTVALEAPERLVLQGPPVDLRAACARLAAHGIRTRALAAVPAFHSPAASAAAASYATWADDLRPPADGLEAVSTVTGAWARDDDLAGGGYWRRELCQPVRFADALQTLRDAGCTLFLELGPGAALCARARRDWPQARWLPSLRGRNAAVWLSSLAALYLRGATLDWGAVGPRGRTRVALPTYPFQRQPHWLAPAPESAARPAGAAPAPHPLLGIRLPSRARLAHAHTWELDIGARWRALLDGHRLRGQAMLPLAMYLELARAAAQEALGAGAHSVVDLRLERALEFSAAPAPRLQISLVPETDGTASVSIHSRLEGASAPTGFGQSWTLHATARIHAAGPPTESRLRQGGD